MLGGSMVVQGTRHLRLFILFSCWVLQGSPEECPFEPKRFNIVFNLCCNPQALILWLLYGPGHNSWEDSRTPHSRECTTKDRKYWCQCNLITVSGRCLTRGFLALSLFLILDVPSFLFWTWYWIPWLKCRWDYVESGAYALNHPVSYIALVMAFLPTSFIYQ